MAPGRSQRNEFPQSKERRESKEKQQGKFAEAEGNRKNNQQRPGGTNAGVNNTKVIELCFVSLSTGYQPVADDRADG